MSATHELSLNSRILNLIVVLGLFSLLYPLTNLYAQALFNTIHLGDLNGDVYPSSFLWSRKIYNLVTPLDSKVVFISEMIVPYSWSILLLSVSFFWVQTANQLSLLTRRLVLATLIACLLFYLFPAKYSFERPNLTNWTQFGYQFLTLTDKPFNQFPSLHVAYALLLGGSLWTVAKTLMRRTFLGCVCSLIIISTVLTYQHHLLDIVGGLLLAATTWRLANSLRSNLVLKYIAVAITGYLLLCITGFVLSLRLGYQAIEGLLVLVAAYWLISFLALAWAYQYPIQARNKRWFSKNKLGQFRLSTWLTFAPLLFGYRLMWYMGQYYMAHHHPIKNNAIRLQAYLLKPSVYTIATSKLLKPIQLLNQSGSTTLKVNSFNVTSVTSIIVVDLAAEVSSHYLALKNNLCIDNDLLQTDYLEDSKETLTHNLMPLSKLEASIQDNYFYRSRCIYDNNYVYFPLLDLQALSDIQLSEFIQLFKNINSLISIKEEALQRHTIVNFHCVMGLSRSVAVQVLYLVYCGKLNTETYRAWIDTYCPHAHISKSYLPVVLIEQMVLQYKKERL